LPLPQSCDVVALHSEQESYQVRCSAASASLDLFSDFLLAIEGQHINVTTDNYFLGIVDRI
jgi:hypothetical protein